jgi:hypothetical protein
VAHLVARLGALGCQFAAPRHREILLSPASRSHRRRGGG